MTNYVVTGATGYLGSNLVRRLLCDGHHVLCILRQDSNLCILPNSEKLTVYKHQGDMQEFIFALEAFKPQVVFHLASYFIAEHMPEHVSALIQANLLFGSQLLEAMSITGVRHFINTGTYWQHYHSNDYDPVCLYAATKEAFEKIILFYVHARQFNCITLKLFDTYGQNDFRKKLIPLLKKHAETGKLLEMSPGEQRLDLVHVDDVVNAYLIAEARLRQYSQGGKLEEFAVASGKSLSLREIVRHVEEGMNKPVRINWGGRFYRAREVMTPWSNYETLPGWSAKYSFPEGLFDQE